MNEEQERRIAMRVLDMALGYSILYAKDKDGDVSAATAAILMRAFELATQDLSVERRKKLLKGEWE